MGNKDGTTCETCAWLFEWFMVCCNGESPYCADIVNLDWQCDGWTEKSDTDLRKEVEEQLG